MTALVPGFLEPCRGAVVNECVPWYQGSQAGWSSGRRGAEILLWGLVWLLVASVALVAFALLEG